MGRSESSELSSPDSIRVNTMELSFFIICTIETISRTDKSPLMRPKSIIKHDIGIYKCGGLTAGPIGLKFFVDTHEWRGVL